MNAEHDIDAIIADYLETGDETTLSTLDQATADDARSMRAALDDESAWAAPSGDLLDRIGAEVRSTPQERDVASLAHARARRSQPRRLATSRFAAAAVGLAAGLLLAVVVGAALRSSDDASSRSVALAATALRPGLTGHAELRERNSGLEIVLDIEHLPRAPRGSFYEAWLRGPKGLVPVGTFHTGGTVTLWSGVDARDYPQFSVTLEPEDGNPASSGRAIVKATLGTN